MNVVQGIQIKIYPNQHQKQLLNQMFGNDRFLWNQLLGMMLDRHKNNHKAVFLSAYDLNYLIKSLKQEYEFLKLSDSSSLQVVTNNLIQTWKMFFKKPKQFGKPHFHSRKSAKKSYVGKSTIKILKKHYLKLPKIGVLKVAGLNQLMVNDKIKRYQVTIRPSGQYYLSLQIEREKQAFNKTNQQVGIDLGLHDLAITSDNQKYHKLNFGLLETKVKQWQKRNSKRRHQDNIIVEQYNHNHKDDINFNKASIYDFQNWQHARRQKATFQAKIAQCRKDILHKITTELVQQYDVIVLEDLKVKNMLKNHHVAHAISNHAWSMFKTMLSYKCEWYGKQLILVNPKNTSRICHYCGLKNHQFDGMSEDEWLSTRNWTCPNCHEQLDRDVNAAKNILNRGLKSLI